MKRILSVSLLLVITALAVQAQEYKKFRVGLGAGYAMPGGSGAKGGVCLYLEPGYRINDQIIANFRMESAIIARGSATETSVSMDVAGIGSYTLNGQYYFMNGGFRPFAGFGFGLFSLAAVSMDANSSGAVNQELVAATSKVGFYPRVGFDAKHFTLSLDYNIVPETNGIKNSYLGFKIGGFFGGGAK